MNKNKINFLICVVIIFITTSVASVTINLKELHILKELSVDISQFSTLMIINAIIMFAAFFVLMVLTFNLFHKEVNFDCMTKLCSRQKLFNDLKILVFKKQAFTLCFIDFNDFKHVNDNFGHSAGDELLIGFAKRILEINHKVIIGYRIGGDEFVIIIKNTLEKDKFIELIKKVADTPVTVKKNVNVNFSFEMGTVDNDFKSNADQLLEKADYMMYRKKRT